MGSMGCKCGSPSVEKLGGRYRYKISDASLDCEDERILITAWSKLGKFPVHVNHDRSREVGNAQVFIRDGSLVADVEVTADDVRVRVDSGELSMASVGFSRQEFTKTDDGKIITTKAELEEVSLVDLGCNFAAHREKQKEQAVGDNTTSAMSEQTEQSETPAPDAKGRLEMKLSFPDMKEILAAISTLTASHEDFKRMLAVQTEDLKASAERIRNLETGIGERDTVIEQRNGQLKEANDKLAAVEQSLVDMKALVDSIAKERDDLKVLLEAKTLETPASKLSMSAKEIDQIVERTLKELAASTINYHTGRLS